MNPWAICSAIASLVGVLVTLVGVAYMSGQLTQKITDNHNSLVDHDQRLNRHDDRLGDHSDKLGRLTEWKDGFNAGVNKVTGVGQ